jgi:hypothetical protein
MLHGPKSTFHLVEQTVGLTHLQEVEVPKALNPEQLKLNPALVDVNLFGFDMDYNFAGVADCIVFCNRSLKETLISLINKFRIGGVHFFLCCRQ